MARRLAFKIRHGYHPDEIPRLREIERECFEFGVAWNLKQFKENLPVTQVWICEAKGEIAGFLIGWLQRGRPYIASIDVASKYRGNGIASALIAACSNYYADLGYTDIGLLVHTDNPAQVLYFKLGFRTVKFHANLEYGSQRKNMLESDSPRPYRSLIQGRRYYETSQSRAVLRAVFAAGGRKHHHRASRP